MKYKALRVKEENGGFLASIDDLEVAELPESHVRVRVEFSSLNFKDALSFSGNKGVTRSYPHTPGIDAAGVVEASNDANFKVGDKVIVTGYDLGMNTNGGFGELITVPANWVVARPEAMSARAAMSWGTAGLTAALCVEKLLPYINAGAKVAVTGSSGGVGSIAIQLLAKLGFKPIAVTRSASKMGELKAIGAHECILLDDLKAPVEKRPLGKPSFDAAIDTIGGETLDALLKQTGYQGSVACCGLVESPALNTTVLPFILRGVNLLGVDSVELPIETKQSLWNKLAVDWTLENLEEHTHEITLNDLSDRLSRILSGDSSGHYVLRHG